ncbi:MAG: peptidoglycan DD-metalloendopeptidase family protein [Patescibacteria group bacterium]|nr:peptidoglycan DD-metalloendopeptidase family protein [Patescibacteria group bacterium]
MFIKKYNKYLIIFGALFLGSIVFLISSHKQASSDNTIVYSENEVVVIPEIQDRQELVEIKAGSTFGELMHQIGIAPALASEIYASALDKCDLAQIRAGHFLEVDFDKESDEFKQLKYKIDSENELLVIYGGDDIDKSCSAEVVAIDYEVKIVTKEGKISSSMYAAALDNNIDERAIIELADAFQWSIDFAMDPRVDDTFKFIYEERYLDGQYVMPGKILAGQYINDGHKYEVYYFEEDGDNVGYFDADGNSVQKMFLKAPVAFKYISSGYTTGLRYVEAFNVSTGHRAIDYAATYGTPIRAVGDGTVIMASYNGAYGNMVKIRHNGTYQTNYGHMSKFAVKKGEKVKQGDVIGYVGSTGFSTGPHVHYEMEKNGVKINPLLEVLPPGQAILDTNKERFFSTIKEYQAELN